MAHGLSQFFSYSLDVVNADVACSIIIEEVKDLVDSSLNY